jgi:hypothetical protein
MHTLVVVTAATLGLILDKKAGNSQKGVDGVRLFR